MVESLAPLFAQVQGGSGFEYIEAIVIVLLFSAVVTWIGRRLASDTDGPWLKRYIGWAYLLKVMGSLARYWMVTVLYESGDSFRYQVAGETFANVWRAGSVPVSGAGGEGTAFTEVATGLIYAVYTPTFLGGFLIFATLSFLGQILFYAAFRRWFGAEKQRLYALAVFFLPSLAFWPSSIGKDALMVLFLGLAAYGASLLLHDYKLVSIPIVGVGLALAAGVRPHVAGVFAIALVLGILFGKPLEHLRGSTKRPIFLILAAGATAVVLITVSATFEVTFEQTQNTADISGFLEDVSEQTGQGGSQIDGISITTPSRLPLAIMTVLFRPLIHEGANLQMLASALEGTALLGLVVWKLPQMWKNKGLLRRKAYLTMSLFYTGGFIIGFSAILNLGIMARQRVQLLPFFLALLVGLAWPEPDPHGASEEEDHDDFVSPRPPPRTPAYSPPGPRAIFDVEERHGVEAVPSQGSSPDRLPSVIETGDPRPHTPEPEKTGSEEVKPEYLRDRIRPEVVRLYTSDPDISIGEISRQVDASRRTVRRVLTEEGLR